LKLTRRTLTRTFLFVGLTIVLTNGVTHAQGKAVPRRKVVECIKKEDVACVAEFLSRGGDAKAVDDKGSSLLMIASETKSATLVRLLISAGADANAGSADSTPLCRAALFGRKEIAQTLLEAGAKVSVVCDGDHGDSALMEAIRGVMLSVMPDDLKASIFSPEDLGEATDGETNNLRQVLETSSDDYLEIAHMLLGRGADVNVVAKCDAGETALMYAVMSTNVNLVKSLLAHGAQVSKDPSLLDALREFEMEYERVKWVGLPTLSRQQAGMLEWTEKTRASRKEILDLLTAAGATLSPRDEEDDYKKDAQGYATEAFDDVIQRDDQKDFERLLVAYKNHPLGAAVLPNALRVAVIYARVEMVKLLLESGVNPNLPTNTPHYTPLMHAASSANLELVRLLIDANADLNAEDSSGDTALDAAAMYSSSSEQHRTVVAFLKERGARNGHKQK
jgi:ankyrin repeat protein